MPQTGFTAELLSTREERKSSALPHREVRRQSGNSVATASQDLLLRLAQVSLIDTITADLSAPRAAADTKAAQGLTSSRPEVRQLPAAAVELTVVPAAEFPVAAAVADTMAVAADAPGEREA